MNWSNVHTPHIVLCGYLLTHFLFLIASRKFIQEALRKNGVASSVRLTGFMFTNLLCFCEAWRCVMLHTFDRWDLLYTLLAIGFLYGIINAKDVLEFRNGRRDPDPVKSTTETDITINSTTKTEGK